MVQEAGMLSDNVGLLCRRLKEQTEIVEGVWYRPAIGLARVFLNVMEREGGRQKH